jgi:hypothetical protein
MPEHCQVIPPQGESTSVSSAGEVCLTMNLVIHRKASRLFQSTEAHLEYLEDFGFDDARLTLLKTLGRWVDAAELLYDQGQHLEAIPLWLRAGDLGAKRRACQCLLDSLWKRLPLGANPNIDDDLRNTFPELLRTLDEHLDEKQREEVTSISSLKMRFAYLFASLLPSHSYLTTT